MSDKIELLKNLQESELRTIKGQHERAMQRLKEKQSKELESIKKRHESALKMTEKRIVTTKQVQ